MFKKFLLVGFAGFFLDTGLTHLLMLGGVGPLWARVPAMLCALVFTWLLNRRFTFNTRAERGLPEMLRYALTAGSAFLMNYGLYSLAIANGFLPLVAIVLATSCQVFFSFISFKRFVFGRS